MPDISDLAIQTRQLVKVPAGDPMNKPEKHFARTQTHKTSPGDTHSVFKRHAHISRAARVTAAW
jgi:hypothetical protein